MVAVSTLIYADKLDTVVDLSTEVIDREDLSPALRTPQELSEFSGSFVPVSDIRLDYETEFYLPKVKELYSFSRHAVSYRVFWVLIHYSLDRKFDQIPSKSLSLFSTVLGSCPSSWNLSLGLYSSVLACTFAQRDEDVYDAFVSQLKADPDLLQEFFEASTSSLESTFSELFGLDFVSFQKRIMSKFRKRAQQSRRYREERAVLRSLKLSLT